MRCARKESSECFSFITTAARTFLLSLAASEDPVYPASPTQPMKGSDLFIATCTMRVSNSQPDLCPQTSTIMSPNCFRRAESIPGTGTVPLAQCRPRHTEGDRPQHMIDGSLIEMPPQPCYRSCIHHEVPSRSTSTVMLLDKLLSISLKEPERRATCPQTRYTSTLSVQLHASPPLRSSAGKKPAKTTEGYRRPRPVMDISDPWPSLSKQRGRRVEQTAPSVNRRTDDSDAQHHSIAVGLLSFRGPCPSNTKPAEQKGNADEAALTTRSNFKHSRHTFNIGPGKNFITSPQK